MELVVKAHFGDYKIGDRITDQAKVASVLESHPHAVVKVADRDPPSAPAQKPTP